jgi:hypothetical protein
MHRGCFREQENGGLAVLNLRVGQLLRQHNCCSYIVTSIAIPLDANSYEYSARLLATLADFFYGKNYWLRLYIIWGLFSSELYPEVPDFCIDWAGGAYPEPSAAVFLNRS